MRIGYARVSTRDQNPDGQHDALKVFGNFTNPPGAYGLWHDIAAASAVKLGYQRARWPESIPPLPEGAVLADRPGKQLVMLEITVPPVTKQLPVADQVDAILLAIDAAERLTAWAKALAVANQPVDVRPAGAPDRFVTSVEGLIFLGSSHGGDEEADFGPFRYGRLLRGKGSLVRFDVGAVRFARYVAPDGDAPGYWLVDPTLIDYFEGDERGGLAEVDASSALAFIEAGAILDL